MEYRKTSSPLKKLWVGFGLRCPNCEDGILSERLLEVKATCPVCQVRFERQPGESTGAMMLALPLITLVAIIAFVLIETLFDFSRVMQMGFLALLVIVLSVMLYRHVRGVWIAVAYLTGGLYSDEEYAARQSKAS